MAEKVTVGEALGFGRSRYAKYFDGGVWRLTLADAGKSRTIQQFRMVVIEAARQLDCKIRTKKCGPGAFYVQAATPLVQVEAEVLRRARVMPKHWGRWGAKYQKRAFVMREADVGRLIAGQGRTFWARAKGGAPE